MLFNTTPDNFLRVTMPLFMLLHLAEISLAPPYTLHIVVWELVRMGNVSGAHEWQSTLSLCAVDNVANELCQSIARW